MLVFYYYLIRAYTAFTNFPLYILTIAFVCASMQFRLCFKKFYIEFKKIPSFKLQSLSSWSVEMKKAFNSFSLLFFRMQIFFFSFFFPTIAIVIYFIFQLYKSKMVINRKVVDTWGFGAKSRRCSMKLCKSQIFLVPVLLAHSNTAHK